MTGTAETIAQAERQQLTMPDRFRDWVRFAITLNGYRIAEEMGLEDRSAWYTEHLNRYRATGAWEGSLLELRLVLFFRQRQDYFAGGNSDETIDAFNLIDSLMAAIARKAGIPYQTDQEAQARAEKETEERKHMSTEELARRMGIIIQRPESDDDQQA